MILYHYYIPESCVLEFRLVFACLFLLNRLPIYKYCRVPARWGLRQTTLAPGSDKTRVQGSFWSVNRWTVKKKHGSTIGPVLLRQGEPGTSQYIQ